MHFYTVVHNCDRTGDSPYTLGCYNEINEYLLSFVVLLAPTECLFDLCIILCLVSGLCMFS